MTLDSTGMTSRSVANGSGVLPKKPTKRELVGLVLCGSPKRSEALVYWTGRLRACWTP
jgi:hypothetical protein